MRDFRTGLFVLFILSAGSLHCTSTKAAQPYYDAEFSVDHDTNIGNAERGVDKLDDNILIFGVAASQPYPVTPRSGLLFSGSASYRRYTRWEDLSHWALGGKFIYRLKPGAAYDAEWFELTAGATLLQHQRSSLRDGGIVFVDLATGRKLTDQLEVRGGYQYSVRRAWNDDVFDNDDHRFYAHFDWRLADRHTLYGTLAWQTGDVVSTATQDVDFLAVSTAASPDHALSSENHPARIAYRIGADTLSSELGFNYAFTASLAFDLSARYLHADGDGNQKYNDTRILAGLLYRF
jgi:hypothetical protein